MSEIKLSPVAPKSGDVIEVTEIKRDWPFLFPLDRDKEDLADAILKANKHIRTLLSSLEATQLELKQADQLREIRDGQLEELKVKSQEADRLIVDLITDIAEVNLSLEKEKKRVRDLEKHHLEDHNLISEWEHKWNEINEFLKQAEVHFKDLEELITIQNDTITFSETKINEAEEERERLSKLLIEARTEIVELRDTLASLKADPSIGKLEVEDGAEEEEKGEEEEG